MRAEFAALIGVAVVCSLCSGEDPLTPNPSPSRGAGDEAIVFNKVVEGVKGKVRVEVLKGEEKITTHDDPITDYPAYIAGRLEELDNLLWDDPVQWERVTRKFTGNAITYTVCLSDTAGGVRSPIRKFLKFYPLPDSTIPSFKIYDASVRGGMLYLLVAEHPVVCVEAIRLRRQEKARPEDFWCEALFAKDSPFWPIKNARIVATDKGAHVAITAKSGKTAVWEVKKGKAEQVWVNDGKPDAPPPKVLEMLDEF